MPRGKRGRCVHALFRHTTHNHSRLSHCYNLPLPTTTSCFYIQQHTCNCFSTQPAAYCIRSDAHVSRSLMTDERARQMLSQRCGLADPPGTQAGARLQRAAGAPAATARAAALAGAPTNNSPNEARLCHRQQHHMLLKRLAQLGSGPEPQLAAPARGSWRHPATAPPATARQKRMHCCQAPPRTIFYAHAEHRTRTASTCPTRAPPADPWAPLFLTHSAATTSALAPPLAPSRPLSSPPPAPPSLPYPSLDSSPSNPPPPSG